MDGSAKNVEKSGQIEQQTIKLSRSMDKLSSLIEDLFIKLSAILREELPTNSKEDKIEQQLVPLAAYIRDKCEQADFAVYQLERLIDRLEL